MAIETNADVAQKVRGLAAEHRVSQTAMAKTLSVSRMSMHRRMTGSTPFTAEELIRLSRVIGVPVSAFFGDQLPRSDIRAA